MASTKSTTTARKRVEAAVLKRARDGSAFTRCEACNKNVPVVLIDLHSCSLDSKIRISLESQIVEKAVEISKPEKKRKAPSSAAGSGKGSKKGKSGGGGKSGNGKKRPPTAFFIFMKDFRLEFKASHPDEKGIAAVGKAAGVKWKAMTDEEKKPYLDQAQELKAKFNNGEASEENDVAEENAEAVEEEEEEVKKPEEKEDVVPAAEEELEKNELDDDI